MADMDEEPEDAKVEEKFVEKRESPWAEPRNAETQRVVGWRNGTGFNKDVQQQLLREEKDARQEYRDTKKAIAQSTAHQQEEPLAGLPPTWQAFWSTVPDLDAQAAYRQYRKELQRQERARQQAEAEAHAQAQRLSQPVAGEEGDQTVEEETARLEAEVRRRKEVLEEKERVVAEWDRKLAKVRAEDREEDERAKKFKRVLESASFKHGILQGKIRSSDTYFHYLYEDTKGTHSKKMTTLKRACALMAGQINNMKGEVRQLLKVAADALPPSEHEGSIADGAASALEDDVSIAGDAASKPSKPGEKLGSKVAE